MAVIGTSYFPAIFPPVLRRETTLSSSKLNSNQIPKRYAAASSTDDASTSVKPTPRRSGTGRFGKKSGGEAENMQKRRGVDGDDDVDEGSSKEVNESEAIRKSLKNYFDEAAVMIRSDGGPPRWFSPLECGSRSPDSPLLIYLPGIDGIGIGLVMQHQALGKIFDIWCLHLPVQDRTSFTGLMNLIEKTVRSEHDRLPKRPIYIVGESIGACLALAVAARNSDIDLVQILANPATSFANSRLQAAIPSLQLMPDPTTLGISYILSLITGHQLDPLKMVINNAMKGFSLGSIIEDLAQTLASFTSYLPVMANILPKETLLWKLELLESASSYANARLREVKAQTLVLTSGNDPLLPSQEEGERLRRALPNCQTRKFNDHGHFLFLENDINLVTIIKGASFYRRGKYIDYVSDYIPITSSEFNKIHQYNRWWMAILSPVMLSTFADGKIVRGLSGIPSEGPVILVGYHMLLGLEVTSMMSQFMMERNILLRGITHPMLFQKPKEGGVVPDIDPSGVVNLVGAVPATGANLYKLLASKSHVLLYPGGAREALHRKGEEYKLFWPERSEFVRMAAKFGATIIPFGAVGEDDVAQIVLDYNDQMKIPFLRSLNEKATEETVKLRTDANGEVSNQQLHNPYFLPKVPGRFYYYFGKPIETKGRKEELDDKKKAQELYIQVKSEVERCIAYLKEKREKDPYRHLLPRLFFQTIHGFESEIPTFEL